MSKKTEETATLAAILAHEFKKLGPWQAARLACDLKRLGSAATLRAVRLCNVPDFDADKAKAALERRMIKLCERYGVKLRYRFGGDPRGYCLRLFFRGNHHNTWGGASDGWGV